MKPIVKARSTINGEIQYGYHVERSGHHYVIGKFGFGEIPVHPNTICLMSPIKDKKGREIYVGDKLLDEITKREFTVMFGFCRKYAFTGFYVEASDGYQATLNNDDDSDRNSQIILVP